MKMSPHGTIPCNPQKIRLTVYHKKSLYCSGYRKVIFCAYNRLSEYFSSHPAQLGYKLIVQLGQLIVLTVYHNILVHSAVLLAGALNQPIPLKQYVRHPGYPHECVRIVG